MTMSADKDGIFDTLLKLVRAGLGGKAASGEQFISWIHANDFVRAIDFLIEHQELNGCMNLCSPCPLPNKDFMSALRKAWGTPIGLPAAQWMLALGAIFLRTETELILKSRRVVPQRLLEAGFTFNFADWTSAASDLVKQWRKNHTRV
jgi:NAD dependent epimerase/dehydratase family enzyme